MNVSFSKQFEKKVKKLPIGVKKKLRARLFLFMEDPYNALLNNHALRGEYSGYRSINITGDHRAIFRLFSKEVAYFIDIGTHSYLYE